MEKKLDKIIEHLEGHDKKFEQLTDTVDNLARMTSNFIANQTEWNKKVDNEFKAVHRRLDHFAQWKADRKVIEDLTIRVSLLEEKVLA